MTHNDLRMTHYDLHMTLTSRPTLKWSAQNQSQCDHGGKGYLQRDSLAQRV